MLTKGIKMLPTGITVHPQKIKTPSRKFNLFEPYQNTSQRSTCFEEKLKYFEEESMLPRKIKMNPKGLNMHRRGIKMPRVLKCFTEHSKCYQRAQVFPQTRFPGTSKCIPEGSHFIPLPSKCMSKWITSHRIPTKMRTLGFENLKDGWKCIAEGANCPAEDSKCLEI